MTDDDRLNFLNDIEQPKITPGRRSRGKKFSTGLETVSHKEAAKATASKSMAGNYMRYTAYLSPESIARLKEIADKVGLSQAETARWFVEHMIELYDLGLRPETEIAIVRRRLKRPSREGQGNMGNK